MRKQENPCYGLLIIVVFLTSSSFAQTNDEVKKICETEENQRSCQACITANALCSWCEKIDLRTKRCTLHSENEKACTNSEIINPMSHFEIEKDDNFTEAGPGFFDNEENIGKTVIQIRPQNITVKLRKGQPTKFNVTFKKVIDYPLDIYYVMDLSYSMNDDLEVLQRLGTNLFDQIKENVTENVQLGFGSFVDKVMMPFASTVTEQLENPCASQPDAATCATPFGFRHQVSITGNATVFNEAIQSTEISGNIDIPEGSFDALMQIAVCEHIKWRDGATRVILLTTDASPHIALDGKLAAILEANDMKCHLLKGANERLPEAIVYAKSKTMDYPSLGQLKEAFSKNKIHSIFAVTDDVVPLYKDIENVISNAYVSELLADSSNIIPLINQTYGELKGRLAVETSSPPSYVTQSNRVLCPKGDSVAGKMQCDGIEIDDQVIFEFEFTASECPSDPNHRDVIKLTSSSLQDEVTINLEYICECDCQATGVANSSKCEYHGSLTCGVCSCEPGRDGTTCQCESTTTDGTSILDTCKREGSDLYCEGVGSCDCGACKCDPGYDGVYCECKTTGCPSDSIGVCGGETDDGAKRGNCKICPESDEKCHCNLPFSLDSRGTCTCTPEKCKQTNESEICSGRGDCECDKCKCHNQLLWEGSYCHNCRDPECTGVDATCNGAEIKACAECRARTQDACTEACGSNEFLVYSELENFPDCSPCQSLSSSSFSDCKKCLKRNQSEPLTCTHYFDDGCSYNYLIVWTTDSLYQVTIRTYNQARDCPPPVDPLVIALPVVGGILLIGIILLIAWKVYTTLRDKRQYEEFLEEEKKRKWTKGENPIFQKPEENFVNPMFQPDTLDG